MKKMKSKKKSFLAQIRSEIDYLWAFWMKAKKDETTEKGDPHLATERFPGLYKVLTIIKIIEDHDKE